MLDDFLPLFLVNDVLVTLIRLFKLFRSNSLHSVSNETVNSRLGLYSLLICLAVNFVLLDKIITTVLSSPCSRRTLLLSCLNTVSRNSQLFGYLSLSSSLKSQPSGVILAMILVQKKAILESHEPKVNRSTDLVLTLRMGTNLKEGQFSIQIFLGFFFFGEWGFRNSIP